MQKKKDNMDILILITLELSRNAFCWFSADIFVGLPFFEEEILPDYTCQIISPVEIYNSQSCNFKALLLSSYKLDLISFLLYTSGVNLFSNVKISPIISVLS